MQPPKENKDKELVERFMKEPTEEVTRNTTEEGTSTPDRMMQQATGMDKPEVVTPVLNVMAIEMPVPPSLKNMTERKQKFFRERSHARRQGVRYFAELAYHNLIKDLGLAEVDSRRSVVAGFEGKAKDAKPTASTNKSLAALLYLVHRLESGDKENPTGLIPQARRILKDRRKNDESNRRRDLKREVSARYLAKLAAIKKTS